MYTSGFWLATLERLTKTFAQSMLAILTLSQPLNILNVNWVNALGLSAGMAVLSLLTSLASINIGPAGSPSLVGNGSAGGKHEG